MLKEMPENATDMLTPAPEVNMDLLAKTLIYTNILRMRIIAWLLVMFNSILICIQLIYVDQVDLPSALRVAPYIINLRAIFILISAVFLLVCGTPVSASLIKKRHYFYQFIYTLLILIGFAVLSGLIQSVGPGIASSYLMSILISATFFYWNWHERLVIYSVPWLVLSIMLWHFQSDWLVAFSAFINGSFMTVLAIIISQVIYTSHVREVVKQESLELSRKELVESNNMLQRLSYLDALTKIPNRRFMNEYLNRQWSLAFYQKTLICLIMIDIDLFKPFNDTFGHQTGDDILIKVAAALKKAIKRPDDIAVRYGGDEFIVILPKTNSEGAGRVAERMRHAVKELNIVHSASPTGRLTISMGLACVQPDGRVLWENLINAADEALYQAKRSGGNQYIFNTKFS